jgi:putative MFS transporter
MDNAPDNAAIGARLDHMPVTRLHCVAIALCATGFAFDLFEIALGTVLSAVFTGAPHRAAPAQIAVLLASVYVGATLGSPVFGWMADRFGRRVMLMSMLMVLALTSLAGAGSSNVGELSLWRCLAGLALGAYPPLMISYLTDILPAGRRGALIMVTIAIGTLGPATGIFIVLALLPLQPMGVEAWRWGMAGAGTGAGLIGMLFVALPESPRWLQSRGRTADAEAQCLRFDRSPSVLPARAPLPQDSSTVAAAPASPWRSWSLLAALYFLSPWATVAFPLMTGVILTQKGFRLSDTLLYVGLSNFGPLLGTLLVALGVDRIGRRAALAICAGVMMATGWLFVSSNTPIWLIAGSFGFSLVSILAVTLLNLYGSELFPTQSRATALSAAWAFNRVGAACAPLLLLPLLGSTGPKAMFLVIALSLCLNVALLTIAPPGRPRRSVA